MRLTSPLRPASPVLPQDALGRPLRDLRLSVIDACNFRCPYCMTAARFERSRDALVKDFTEVLTEADSLLKQATKESGEKASDLRAQVEAKLRAAKLKLQDMPIMLTMTPHLRTSIRFSTASVGWIVLKNFASIASRHACAFRSAGA